jgi:hypothetical protein
LLRRAAEADHKTLTNFILASACLAAEQTLLDQRLFMVSGTQALGRRVTWRQPDPLAVQHRLEDFDCGKPTLNHWLLHHARQAQTSDSARTFVVDADPSHRRRSGPLLHPVWIHRFAAAPATTASATQGCAQDPPASIFPTKPSAMNGRHVSPGSPSCRPDQCRHRYLHLCRFFGLSEGFWLRMQAGHDLKLVMQALGGVLPSIEAWLTRHIGLSNFSSRKLHDLLDHCRISMNRCSWTTR